MMPMEEWIVRLENVGKIYTMDKVQVPALRGISFEIYKREFISVMGPSGSGKSTVMNLIGCLDRPTSGAVYIDGKNVSRLSENKLAEMRRKKVGFIFQQFNLIPRLNALENVELPMWFAGVTREKRSRQATELLRAVGLEHRLKHRPTELSGGERQRVAVARALANSPEIILADEPTGNLDSKSGEEIIALLQRLNEEEGKTVVIVTHELEFGRKAQRMIMLRDGLIERIEVKK